MQIGRSKVGFRALRETAEALCPRAHSPPGIQRGFAVALLYPPNKTRASAEARAPEKIRACVLLGRCGGWRLADGLIHQRRITHERTGFATKRPVKGAKRLAQKQPTTHDAISQNLIGPLPPEGSDMVLHLHLPRIHIVQKGALDVRPGMASLAQARQVALGSRCHLPIIPLRAP